jgi:hypothetical protein
MQTFTSIMRNKSIWLTKLRDSNDSREGQWAKTIFEQYRRSSAPEYFNKAYEIINAATYSGREMLGMCFSAEHDLLSQWRGYADNGQGFTIGFSVETLVRLKQKLNSTQRVGLELEKIEYVQNLSSDFFTGFKDFVDEQKYSSDGRNASILIDNIGLQVWVKRLSLIKNAAFNEEQELRLFTLYPNMESPELDYRQVGGKLSPYLRVNLDEYLDDIITSVTLGPRNTSEKDHVRNFVAKCGFSRLRDISKSKATYR